MKDDPTNTIASFEKSLNEIHDLICDQIQDADDDKSALIDTAIGQLGGLTSTISAIINTRPTVKTDG
jgi:hypothetical protein